MVFGLLSHATSVLIGALYPAFKTFKVIRDGHYNEMMKWLKYWTVYAGFLAVETVGDAFFLQYIIPGYLILKNAFLLWIASPWTDGAALIHQKFVAPLLTSYEHDIDDMLDNMRYSVQRRFSALGNGALDRARIGLLSVGAVESSSTIQEVFRSRNPSVTSVVEEQDEEDVVFLGSNGIYMTTELDYDSAPAATAVAATADEDDVSMSGRSRKNATDLRDVAVTGTKSKKPRRRNERAKGDTLKRRRARRVMAGRSSSRER